MLPLFVVFLKPSFAICFHVCIIYLLLCFLTEHLFIIFSNNLLISISRQNDRTHSFTNFHNLSLQKISPHQSILQQKLFHLGIGPLDKYYGSCGLETGQWGCTLILTDIIAQRSSNSKVSSLSVYSIQYIECKIDKRKSRNLWEMQTLALHL